MVEEKMSAKVEALSQGLRRVALADGVYEAIKTLIMDRQIEPGSKINMDELARGLSVSATPVREALARLEADGLVTKRPLVGYTAAPLLDAAGVGELFELRLLLEPAAARWAAEVIGQPDAAALVGLVSKARDATKSSSGEDYRAYRLLAAHDREFHETIASASGRVLMAQTLRRLHPHEQTYRVLFRRGFDRQTLLEHAAIARALQRRDADAAAAAMTEHLHKARQRVIAAMDAGESG